MEKSKYDAIVVGSGQAGNPMAGYLAGKGKEVLLIEKARLGGTCVNTGCTPSKTMHEAVRKIHHSQKMGYAGFKIRESDFDFNTLMNQVRKLRDESHGHLVESFKKNEKITVVHGHGRFVQNHVIEVEEEDGGRKQYEAPQIFVNTGARPRIPSLKGLDQVNYLTNLNIFDLEKQPKHLIILGGGYIGLEFAQNFQRLGTQVSIVNQGKQIISREDDDIIKLVHECLEAEGVKIKNGQKAGSVRQKNGKTTLTLGDGSTLEGDALLVAVGREPNSGDLGLENTGIEVNEKGHIETNGFLETAVSGVYALGEVAGSAQFTHIAYDDFRVVRDNFEKSGSNSTENRQVPYTLFIDPQLAAFGLNEKSAQKEKRDYHLYEMDMSSVARANERHEAFGKIKVLCDKKGGKILGATILGVEGGEMITTLQLAAKAGLTATYLREFTFIHPTLAEGFNNLFG